MGERRVVEVAQDGPGRGFLHGEVVVRARPCLVFLRMAVGARRLVHVGHAALARSGILTRGRSPAAGPDPAAGGRRRAGGDRSDEKRSDGGRRERVGLGRRRGSADAARGRSDPRPAWRGFSPDTSANGPSTYCSWPSVVRAAVRSWLSIEYLIHPSNISSQLCSPQ